MLTYTFVTRIMHARALDRNLLRQGRTADYRRRSAGDLVKPKSHLQIRINPEHYAALERIAKRTPDPQGLHAHSTVSDIARRAIIKFLTENGELKGGKS